MKFKSNMEEIWKDIEDFEGYQVSNLGRVRSLPKTVYHSDGRVIHRKAKMLRQIPDGKGYLMVWFYKKKIRYMQKVHRLVASAFIPNTENKPQIDHTDGDKQNNRVSNLRWVTAKENFHNPISYKRNADSKRGALNHKARKVVRISKNGSSVIYDCIQDACRDLGISSNSHILDVCNGRRDYAYGFMWCYDD